jgi:hypothetical protein
VVIAGTAFAGIGLASSLLGVQLAAAAAPAKAHARAAAAKPARSIKPAKVAWYDATRATAAIPATPQAGVKKGDLLVSGVTINTADLPALPLPGNLPVLQRITAFAALQFTIPKGATPATLTLPLDGAGLTKITSKLPSGVSPQACPITSKPKAWKAGDQQSIAVAPKYDCKVLSSTGQISADGTSIQFTGINRLLKDNRLSFVVLPGTLGLDRLVFDRPGKKALSLLRFGGTPVSVPSITPVPTPTGSTGGGSSVPFSGGSGGGGAVNVPVPSGAGASAVPNPGGAPQVAGQTTTTPALQTVAATPINTKRERLAAVALLVALVVTTLWLAATDGSGRAFAAVRVLRALSAGGPLPELPTREWGIGRFKAERTGRPPQI